MDSFIEINKDHIRVREATKKGYAIAKVGDSINLEQPNSKTRRGRVGKQIANTLTCSCNQGVVVMSEPKLIGGIGERNFGKQYRQGNRVYDGDEIAMCLMAQPLGNAGGYSYLYSINNDNGGIKMWKNNLKKYSFDMEELRVADFFSGIGALHKSLKMLGVPVKITNISEIDPDAIISYAGIHIENFKDLEFEYPTDKEMRDFLMGRNIGYSYDKGKSSIPRMKADKLKLVYKASILLNNLGDIAKINYSDIEDFDLMNFSFSCFLPGTLVLTRDGYKNIEDVTENDYVLTHTNTYKKVVKPMNNYVLGNIYKIKSMCATDTYVTEEHPFYVRKRHKINTRKNGIPVRGRVFDKPEWVKSKDLTKDYYVGVAINNECEFPEWDGIEVNTTWSKYGNNKKKINELNKYFNKEDFWWIVGRYIGDGWVSNNIDHKGTDIYNLYICCAKNELNEITDVLDRLNRLGGGDFKYKYYEQKATYQIRIANVEFAKFLQQFGKYAKNKELTKSILDLPKRELKSFLDGYMSSDGCFTQGNFKASSISNKLTYGIAQCEAKVYGRPYSIYLSKRKKQTIIEGRLVNQNDAYEVKWKENKGKQDKAFFEDGYIWCPINNIEKAEYQGLVYNMEVEEDNSYTANGMIVHNCTDLSVSGKQKGMTNEDGTPTRSGLYVYGIKAIMEKRPKYIMIENVKGLIQKKFIDDFYSIVNELEEIGYNCYYPTKIDSKGNKTPTCLNAKDFGIAQNRERIYVICIRKDVDDNTFEFPIGGDTGVRLKDLLEDKVDEKYYLSEKVQERFKLSGIKDVDHNEINNVGSSAPEFRTIGQRDITYGTNGIMSTLVATDYKQPKQILEINGVIQVGNIVDTGNWDNPQRGRIYSVEGTSPTLNTVGGGGLEPKIVVKKEDKVICEQRTDEGLRFFKDNVCGTLRTIDACGDKRIIENGQVTRIRKLTPKECWRLMGFDDEDFDNAQSLGVSDSQLYKQAGNSIVVNVLYYIFKNLFNKYIN